MQTKTNAHGRPALAMDALQTVSLGTARHWIRVRGTSTSNPPLLLMQLGPGLPIINEARRFERLLALEDAFTVVYWDQRGTGLSLRDVSNRSNVNVAHMVADTVSMLERLRDRFGAAPVVAGFSFGATFAAYAAVQRPDLVATLIAVGMDVDIAAAETNADAFALRAARERGNRRAARQLERIGPPPHLGLKEFSTRVRWVANFGGVATNASYNATARALLVSLARSRDYSPADVIRTLRGIRASQAALVPELAATDLVRTMPRVGVPIVMVQGRLDQVAPGEAAQRFYDALEAPSKQLVWFEQSAHTPHLEEPERFRDVVMMVRTSRIADTS
jgi:pimeloyl-ACP methyl ester carboxylesterase